MGDKKRFAGVVPLAKRFFFGESAPPKLRKYGTTITPLTTPNDTNNYEALKPDAYRWFRQDELVRKCVVVNAAYATMAAGFETELEPIEKVPEEELPAFLEKYQYVKEYVDEANRKVNLDNVLFVAQVKRSVYGKAAFEIVPETTAKNSAPAWLLSLSSTKIKPKLNDDTWALEGFTYDSTAYSKEQVLYFPNLQLENDYEGISDVETVLDVCSARHNLLREDLPEITHNLWAPYAVLSADTSGMNSTDEDAFLDDLMAAAKSGKSIAVNKSVQATVVAINVNLAGLVEAMNKLEETIIRAFGTPRFLINKTPENRATAFVEFDGYISGPIANIQRFFGRELESQWYPQLVKQALSKQGESGVVPVRVKHVWKPIRSSDVYEMANAVAALYANGLGILADFPDLGFEMMGWDKERLREMQEKVQPNAPGLQQPGQPQPNPHSPKEPALPGEETVDDGEPGQT